MTILQAVALALVQALTEFLPISSTAHLFLIPWLFDWQDPGLTFTIVVHAGTLVGVLIYFLRTWLQVGLAALGIAFPASSSSEQVQRNRRVFWYLVAGTIPAALAGALLEHQIETTFRSPVLMGVMLIVFGALLWYAEAKFSATRTIESLTLADALLIGTAQAVALVPGVSRSGVTITAGLFRGMTREASARFTFLLSTPIIAGASLKKLWDVQSAGLPEDALLPLIVGFAVSAISGYLVIALFLRYLQTRSLKIFVYYRFALGVLVLVLAFLQSGPAR
jgi:undecaprenyl-diphosphatase